MDSSRGSVLCAEDLGIRVDLSIRWQHTSIRDNPIEIGKVLVQMERFSNFDRGWFAYSCWANLSVQICVITGPRVVILIHSLFILLRIL